jgi:hypothetical protein
LVPIIGGIYVDVSANSAENMVNGLTFRILLISDNDVIQHQLVMSVEVQLFGANNNSQDRAENKFKEHIS